MIPRASLAPDCRFLALAQDSLRIFSRAEIAHAWRKGGMPEWEVRFWLTHPSLR